MVWEQVEVNGRCYTLDVNPTSASRVKVRLYETRAVRSGGNILLLQGQLSVQQFRALEALLLEGARSEGSAIVHTGRYYTAPSSHPPTTPQAPSASPRRRKAYPTAAARTDRQPRAPWITGPVIGPDGVVADDDIDDDYDALARRHVERTLRRRSPT